MRKHTKKLLSVAICLIFVAVILFIATDPFENLMHIPKGTPETPYPNREDPVIIDDDEVPSDGGIKELGTLIQQTENDKVIIPDKYNTGTKGDSFVSVGLGAIVNGVQFASGSGGERYVLDFYYHNEGVSGTIIINDCDFSKYQMDMYHEGKISRDVKVIFNNCKFSRVVAGKKSTRVNYEFNNCTISGFSGCNAVFNKCAFGGQYFDALVPFQNVVVNDSYFSNLASIPTEKVVHADGTQLYGAKDIEVSDIYFKNCRFEAPPFNRSTSNAYVNSCIMLQLEYSNARNVQFEDCLLNGGGYSIYARAVKGDWSFNNVTFKNISIGCANTFGSIYPQVDPSISMDDIKDTSSLYVSSVWKDKNQTHISVTNDTSSERKLLIITDGGKYNYTIPACIKGKDLNDLTQFEDFPFDIDIIIPRDCKYIVCYDISGIQIKQLRFCNWSSHEIYLDDNEMTAIFGTIISDDEIISEGECGSQASYALTADGTLKITGTGETYNYNSKSLPLYREYAPYIKKVVVESGITKIGTQMFNGYTNITEVILPDTVSSIGKSAFQSCSSLTKINIPSSVTEVGKYAFYGTILQDIYYDGSDEEWNKISVGDKNEIFCATKVTSPIPNPDDTKIESETHYLQKDSCGPCIRYTLSEDGILTITGYGATYNYNSRKHAPWWNYKDKITSVIIDEGITALGTQLFRQCLNVTEVILPHSLRRIGGNAFSSCKSLTKIVIPHDVEVIGKYAFNSTFLDEAIYIGSHNEWNNIEIGIRNEKLINCIKFKENM